MVIDPATQLYAVGKRDSDGLYLLFSGGVDPEEDIEKGVLREIKEESGLYDFAYVEKLTEALTHYHNIAKNVNRVAHATCFLAVLNSADVVPLQLEEHEKFSLHWATADEIFENWKHRNEQKDFDHWVYFLTEGVARARELGYDKSKADQ